MTDGTTTMTEEAMQGQPGGQPAEHQVILYTRQGCHLCEDAHAILEPRQQRSGFRLDVIDVDTDPELVRLYGLEVPVVVIDGQVRFRGRVNPVLLDRLLAHW